MRERHRIGGDLRLGRKQVWRQLADFAIALRESRRINVEARWKRQTAAERSSYVRPTARRAGCKQEVARSSRAAPILTGRPQLWPVVRADSAGSTVAAQLPRSFSAFSEREPGSAV